MISMENIKEFLLPELQKIAMEQSHVKERLSSMDAHLVDQSRRIDEINKRIDETNKRIDAIHLELSGEIRETNRRIDAVHSDVIMRIDETNNRLNRLYEVIVRRDEHVALEAKIVERLSKLELELMQLKGKIAA